MKPTPATVRLAVACSNHPSTHSRIDALALCLGPVLDGRSDGLSMPPHQAGDYTHATLGWLQLRNLAYGDEFARYLLASNLKTKIRRLEGAHQ